MNEQTLEQATGRSLSEWDAIIRRAEKADASHKEIADYLHDAHQLSYWWAQEITVEYEKHIGRRVLGQTQDGLFQIGVSKTISAPAEKVWNLVQSEAGISLITSEPDGNLPSDRPVRLSASLKALDALEGQSATGIRVATTTFEAGSHVRMRWQYPGWPAHSILQIRVTPKSETKTTLSFHQEKLPSRDERNRLQGHWRRIAELIAEMTSAPGSATG